MYTSEIKHFSKKKKKRKRKEWNDSLNQVSRGRQVSHSEVKLRNQLVNNLLVVNKCGSRILPRGSQLLRPKVT